jgi:uncharacterized protein YjbI with pentapeptide repeats
VREPDAPDLAPDLELTEIEDGRADGARVVDAAVARVERVVDCALTGCDLANADGRGAKLMRVTIERGRLTGLQLSEAELRDVTIRGCRADLATFGELRGCELRGLQGAERLRGAAIPREDIVRMADVWAAALGIEPLE